MTAGSLQPHSTSRALKSAGERNSAHSDYPDRCVHELFQEQANRTPNAIALSFEEMHITYRELDEMANAVAGQLRGLGAGPGSLVAICMDRSVAMAVGVLGILKSGAGYLPLDPSYPGERLEYMLQDSGAAVLLAEPQHTGKFSIRNIRVLSYDGERIRKMSGAGSLRSLRTGIARPSDTAYVIYTSGSTGRPKGVVMPHSALVNLLQWHLAELPDICRTLQFAPLSFDVSFQEMFSTWSAGGTVELITDEQRRDPEALWNFIIATKIQRLFLPFVALQHLAGIADAAPAPALCEIIVAGEQLRITPKIAALFEKNTGCVLHNHYGPTETHVVTAFTLCGPSGDWPALPPIGVPIANVEIHILDDELQPVATGEAGEIHISGACLASGYLNRPEINAQKFLDHDGVRLYKTGDIGRRMPGGDIEFLGRLDDQIKIRGYRVELAEIEAELLRHPAVSQCAMASPDAGSGLKLVAYVVLWPDSLATRSDDLVAFLKKTLPEYMIPSAFALLDSLPLTPTGKMDRRALPAPGDERFRPMPRMECREIPNLPVAGVEAELIRIWEEFLGVRPIGVNENFFDLGGHSLLAVAISHEVAKRLGKRITLTTIFRAPTVGKLALALNDDAGDKGFPIDKIRTSGSRTPFFCMPGLFDLAHCLGPDQPFYGLNLPELPGEPADWPRLEEIAASSIRAMLAVQPKGPYSVGGYSFGGVVAFEIARQLEASGEKVALLVLLDPDPPRPFRTSSFGFYVSRIIFHGRKIAGFNIKNKLGYFIDRLRSKKSEREASLLKTGDPDPELAAYLLRTETIHTRYQAAPIRVRTARFLAQDTVWRARPGKDPRLEWNEFVGGEIEIYEIPGNHTSVIREPNVRILAKHLGICLENAARTAGPI